MGHFTYESIFRSREYHPDFCKVCFSKMTLCAPSRNNHIELDVLKTELTYVDSYNDRSPVFEPNARGGASKVLVRPHVVLGTACGFEGEGRVSQGPEPGAKLWHSMVWTSQVSICQDGMFEKGNEEQEQKVMEMMGIRPQEAPPRSFGPSPVSNNKTWPTCHFCPEPAVNEWEHNNEPICNDCFQSFTGHTFESIEAEVANTSYTPPYSVKPLKPSIDGSMPEDSMETKRRLQQVMNMATRGSGTEPEKED